jgi:hypothetical protein
MQRGKKGIAAQNNPALSQMSCDHIRATRVDNETNLVAKEKPYELPVRADEIARHERKEEKKRRKPPPPPPKKKQGCVLL